MQTEIIDTAPTWWEIQNIPTEMVRELRRRSNSNNIGMNIPNPFVNATFDFQNNHSKYKGPVTPWIRVFSNGTGQIANGYIPRSGYLNKSGYSDPNNTKPYDGYILKGGDGFYDAFGYNNTTPLTQKGAIIGYEANGEPHFIDPSLRSLTNYQSKLEKGFPQDNVVSSILPPPGIISAQLKQSKEFLTFASFKFNCYTLAQLEYMMPFFLTPGINIFIEFGWNLFNQKSILNLKEKDECWDIVSNPQTALDRANLSYGNYGCVTGIITKYNFTTQNGFVYECNVECTSRQGLFAGFRTDNNATKNQGGINSTEYINLKDFIKIYLPSITDVVKSRSNFVDYVVANKTEIANKYAEKSKEDADADANDQQTRKKKEDAIRLAISVAAKPQSVGKSSFYGGKAEDRVFMGRREDLYRAKKEPSKNTFVMSRADAASRGRGTPNIPANPTRPGTRAAAALQAGPRVTTPLDSNNPTPPSRAAAAAAAGLQGNPKYPSSPLPIQYGSITFTNGVNAQQMSFADKNTDFDAKDTNDEVWMQLDFVFELINLFCSNPINNLYVIDNADVIVNAHPNLISCDKNVLIPNPVAPKVNRGGRFLTADQKNPVKNPFCDINKNVADLELPQSKITAADRKDKNISADKSLVLAAIATAKTFGTSGLLRDDLDRVINWFYYYLNNPVKQPGKSAAFPFDQDKEFLDNKGVSVVKRYKKYYYGYLKNLYISKFRLIEIANDEKVKTLKEFLLAILSTINNSVDNFWEFDIVDGLNGKLSIIDKNTINTDILKKIYMFDLAKTNNVVKSINFDVSLTNEQANNVLFGGSNSPSLTEVIEDKIAKANSQQELDILMTETVRIPSIKFRDRLDIYQLKQISELKGQELAKAQQAGNIPGTNEDFKNENRDIANIQVYGNVARNDILCMRVYNVTEQDKAILKTGAELEDPKYNWKYLCLPPNMKAKLRRMLDDNDISGNIAKYTGVADNFQITLTLDGIYGFRNLQVFAISNLPKPYVPGNVIFQILEVEHNISAGKWETTITALLRCIAGSELEYINI